MGVRRAVSGVVLTTLTVGFLTVAAPSAFALTSGEQAFVNKINAERTSRGLNALVVRNDLVAVARNHSEDMAREGRIWHNPNLDNQVEGWQVLGENVGMGPSVNSLHTAFMNSPHHKENILYTAYNQIGVGNKVNSDGTIYTTHIFVKRSSTSTTTTRPSSTTVQKKAASTSTSSGSSGSQTTSEPSAPPAPVARPKPQPKPVVATPRTVELLVRMVGLDADQVDPATGFAAGA